MYKFTDIISRNIAMVSGPILDHLTSYAVPTTVKKKKQLPVCKNTQYKNTMRDLKKNDHTNPHRTLRQLCYHKDKQRRGRNPLPYSSTSPIYSLK